MSKILVKKVLRPPLRITFKGLSWIETRISPDYKLIYSPTFIIGPPRSGSTLLYQLLTYALSTSYFPLLTGKLRVKGSPTMPVFTAKLAKILQLTERHQETFKNYYGFGKGLGSPYNGIEIWSYWLKDGYMKPEELSINNQQAVYQTVAAIERIFDKPFVNKEQKNSVRLRVLAKIFPDALFIQIKRDPLDVAQSIFIARTQDFPYLSGIPQNPQKNWFSTKPKEYEQIKNKGLIEQVCEQVYYVEQNISTDRALLGNDRFHSINYLDLCKDPAGEMDKLIKFMREKNAPVKLIRPVPESFNYSNGRKLDKDTYQKMTAYLEQLYSNRT